MNKVKVVISVILFIAMTAGVAFSEEAKDNWKVLDESHWTPVVIEKIAIDHVWAGHPVGFFLMTKGDKQYIAYYNAKRRMVAGMRSLSEKKFTLATIQSKLDRPAKTGEDASSTILGWDSHNSVTMAMDREGYIHLAGNMHCNRLTYFRTMKPYDVTSFEQIDSMVGENENSCTYPKFIETPTGDLAFHYRIGGSGNGNEIYNVYDTKTKTWRRLQDKPLTDGRGQMNAYMIGPSKGPDGYYHASWVWRDTPDCSTNHDLSYARSKDLINWETVNHEPIQLPITIDTPGVIVDPVPVQGGIINGTGRFGFDADGRAVLTYHKFDENGKTQLYTARYEEGSWKIRQLTDWDFRWYFSGSGSIGGSQVRVGTVEVVDAHTLKLDYWNKKYGSGCMLLDNTSFDIVGKVIKPKECPETLAKVQSDFEGMGVRWQNDSGDSIAADVQYKLRWETLGANRDHPREGPLPDPSELVLYKIVYEENRQN
jgi:hypothetical protein